MRGQQKFTKMFDNIDICNKLTFMEKVGGGGNTDHQKCLCFNLH
jgi:hypothetical protein